MEREFAGICGLAKLPAEVDELDAIFAEREEEAGLLWCDRGFPEAGDEGSREAVEFVGEEDDNEVGTERVELL